MNNQAADKTLSDFGQHVLGLTPRESMAEKNRAALMRLSIYWIERAHVPS